MRPCKVLAVLALAAFVVGASPAPRFQPVEHFTAKVGIMPGPARFDFRGIDIVIMRWSTSGEHRMLAAALRENGWVEFLDRLCTFEPVGSIVTIGGRELTIRYAWQVIGNDGRRRVFVATDEPMTLANQPVPQSTLAESFTFLELHVDANGRGDGKFSEAARLWVDERQDVIELRDYANRPLHVVMARSLMSLDD